MPEEIESEARARQLGEQRMRAWEEARRLLEDKPKDQEWSEADQAEWARANADIDKIDRELSVYQQATIRQREADAIRTAELSDLGEQRVEHGEMEQREAFYGKLRDMGRPPNERSTHSVEIDINPAYTERHMIRAGMDPSEARRLAWGSDEARALAWDTGNVASAVPVTTARSLYQYMEANTGMLRAPTTKFPTGSGEQMKLPRLSAHAIATQVSGQGTLLAGTDPTFASMTLDAFKYGELVIVANEVLQDAVVDIGQFLTADIGRALGRKIDTDLVVGSGSGAPNGIVTATTGSVVTGGSLITPTFENLVDMVYSIADTYRSEGNAGWLMRDATAGIVRKIRDGAGGTVGQPLWQMSPYVGLVTSAPDTLLGFPIYADPNVASCASAAKTAIFCDFSAYYVRSVGNVIIERDDSRYFDTDQVGFRGKWRVDGDLIDTLASTVLIQRV